MSAWVNLFFESTAPLPWDVRHWCRMSRNNQANVCAIERDFQSDFWVGNTQRRTRCSGAIRIRRCIFGFSLPPHLFYFFTSDRDPLNVPDLSCLARAPCQLVDVHFRCFDRGARLAAVQSYPFRGAVEFFIYDLLSAHSTRTRFSPGTVVCPRWDVYAQG